MKGVLALVLIAVGIGLIADFRPIDWKMASGLLLIWLALHAPINKE